MDKKNFEKRLYNGRDSKKDFELVEQLENAELLNNTPIRARFVHGIRTGNFKTLQNYVKSRPKLLQTAKIKDVVRGLVEKQLPFYLPNTDDFSEGSIPIGYCLSSNGKPIIFKIKGSDLFLHELFISKTGGGKTNLSQLQLIAMSRLPNIRSWVFALDDEYRKLKAFCPDYKIIRVINQFWDIPHLKPHFDIPDIEWLQISGDIFCDENNLKQSSKNILFDTGKWLFEKRGIFKGSNDYPTFQDYLNVFKKRRKSGETYQEKASYEPLINRFNSYVNLGKLFTTRRAIDYKKLQEHNVVFELMGMSAEVYKYFLSMLLSKAFNWRFYEGQNNITHTIVNVIEEARKAIDFRRELNVNLPEPTLHQFVTRGRKYRQCLIYITQELSSISRASKANVNLIVSQPLIEGNELTAIQQTLRLNKEQMDYFVTMPQGRAVVKYDGLPPFVIQIPLVPDPGKTMSDAEIYNEAETFLEDISQDVSQFYKADIVDIREDNKAEDSSEDNGISEDYKRVLIEIYRNPIRKSSDISRLLELRGEDFKQIAKWLERNQFVIRHKIRISEGAPSFLFELTEKAYEALKDWKVEFEKLKGKGSFITKVRYHQVQSKLEKNGWTATIEGKIPETNKLVDILAYKSDESYVAYEVTISSSNILENVEKNLQNRIVKKVILIFENQKDLKKARHLVEKAELKADKDRVEYQLISDFFD